MLEALVAGVDVRVLQAVREVEGQGEAVVEAVPGAKVALAEERAETLALLDRLAEMEVEAVEEGQREGMAVALAGAVGAAERLTVTRGVGVPAVLGEPTPPEEGVMLPLPATELLPLLLSSSEGVGSLVGRLLLLPTALALPEALVRGETLEMGEALRPGMVAKGVKEELEEGEAASVGTCVGKVLRVLEGGGEPLASAELLPQPVGCGVALGLPLLLPPARDPLTLPVALRGGEAECDVLALPVGAREVEGDLLALGQAVGAEEGLLWGERVGVWVGERVPRAVVRALAVGARGERVKGAESVLKGPVAVGQAVGEGERVGVRVKVRGAVGEVLGDQVGVARGERLTLGVREGEAVGERLPLGQVEALGRGVGEAEARTVPVPCGLPLGVAADVPVRVAEPPLGDALSVTVKERDALLLAVPGGADRVAALPRLAVGVKAGEALALVMPLMLGLEEREGLGVPPVPQALVLTLQLRVAAGEEEMLGEREALGDWLREDRLVGVGDCDRPPLPLARTERV